MKAKQKIKNFLLWSQKYTQTDMIYLTKNTFWWIIGKSSIFLISLLTMIIFSNWTSKETYGTYRYILSIIAILNIFSLPGMNTALTRAIARGKEGMFILCAKTKIKWALIGAGICLTISSWYFYRQNFNLGISLLIASIFLVFPPSLNLFLSFWQGKKRFDIQTKYSVLSNSLASLALITTIIFTNNLALIVFAFFASQTLFKAIFFNLSLKRVANQEKEKDTLSFGKHLTLMGSATLLGNQIDKIILWQILGPTAVAIYSFAQLPLLRARELVPVGPLALPLLSQKNVKKIKKELFKKFSKLFLISIPLVILLILSAPLFYKILFPFYSASIPYFRALSLMLIFLPFSLLGTALVTEMKTKELYIIRFTGPIIRIALFLILVPFYGIWGIIFATLITEILNSAMVFYFFKKI